MKNPFPAKAQRRKGAAIYFSMTISLSHFSQVFPNQKQNNGGALDSFTAAGG
jgi:hypothetical protein